MQKHETSSLPKSLKDARSLGHNLYFTGVPCKHGHVTYRYVADRICADCAKEKTKKAGIAGGNARRWANKTPEQRETINTRRREYYQRTIDVRRKERSANYAKHATDPEWRTQRTEKAYARRRLTGRPPEKSNPEVKRRYKQTVRGKANTRANDAKRHTAKLRRTPLWLTADDFWMIEQAYEIAATRTKIFGFSWHVDHVIPLQGRLVSGLHTPYNLQVIPGVDNVAKANKFIPT